MGMTLVRAFILLTENHFGAILTSESENIMYMSVIVVKPYGKRKQLRQSGKFASRRVCVGVTERMIVILMRQCSHLLPVTFKYTVKAVL
jgi:hypothetical protein